MRVKPFLNARNISDMKGIVLVDNTHLSFQLLEAEHPKYSNTQNNSVRNTII